MCGIAGAVWFEAGKALERATLQRMIDVLQHRGPDGEGVYFSAGAVPGAALGHRRLAIIDLAGGKQPLANEDGSLWTVCNGEIYNYRSLRAWLEPRGHVFRTESDTEVLVHLYEELGAEMTDRLNGMFAFAVWDDKRKELFLARDRLGKKPLVYYCESGRLLWASQLKSLLQAADVPREIDPQALDEYLTYQYIPHPRTIFRGICKLPPGHQAMYRAGRLEIRPYWQPDFNLEEPLPEEEYIRRLRELMTSAVELRLQSDVPLGAFLSGGIDSTIVVGLMSQLVGEPVRTFSIGFPVAGFDETDYGRTAARRFRTRHEEFIVTPQAVEILPQLAWHYDEPFADSSAVPTWYVSELTRRQVTVALSGDGGDELFIGYPRYLAVWLAELCERLPGFLRRSLFGRWWGKLPAGTHQKARLRQFQRFVEMLDLPPAERYLEWISIFGRRRREALYSAGLKEALPQEEPLVFLAQALGRAEGRDPLTAFSLADLVTYLPCDLMTKVDVASMAHALECRQPFLDYRVVELAARMPAALKFRRGRGKCLLRRAFADLLPRSIRRRGKMGFGVPLDHWFRHELREFAYQMLFDARTLQRGYFLPEALNRLWQEHQEGRFNHGYRLWALLMLEAWHRHWYDRN